MVSFVNFPDGHGLGTGGGWANETGMDAHAATQIENTSLWRRCRIC